MSSAGSTPESPTAILRQIQVDTRMTVTILQQIYSALLYMNKRGDRVAGEILNVLAEAQEEPEP